MIINRLNKNLILLSLDLSYIFEALMRKIIILIAMSFYSLTALCQKNNFQPGYYVTFSGDTVKGFGKINTAKNKVELEFKGDIASNDIVRFMGIGCREMSFGKDTYITWQGKRSLEYIDKVDLSLIRNNDSYSSEKISLKLLYKGSNFALYQYQGEKDQFFMQINNSIEELILSYDYLTFQEKTQYRGNQLPAYHVMKTYQSQIYAALSDRISKKLNALVFQTEYDRFSLVKLFKKIDGNSK